VSAHASTRWNKAFLELVTCQIQVHGWAAY